MKSFIVFAVVVAAAMAAPPLTPDASATIIRQNLDNIGVDGFESSYETSNGISASESGQLQNVGTENEGIAVRGQFSYVGNDGVSYLVTYIADQNGFQPQGAHLPQA